MGSSRPCSSKISWDLSICACKSKRIDLVLSLVKSEFLISMAQGKPIYVEHQTKIRVRYSETDQMGVVYYGNYAQYFEVARVEFLRDLGFVYKELEDQGVIMPVVHYSTDYKSPAKYDDELTISTKIISLPAWQIKFDYEIFNQNERLVAKATVILVFVNKQTFRPQRAPEYLIQLLEAHSNESNSIR